MILKKKIQKMIPTLHDYSLEPKITKCRDLLQYTQYQEQVHSQPPPGFQGFLIPVCFCVYACIGLLPCLEAWGCLSLACLGLTCLLQPSQIQNSNQAVATTEFWSWSKRKSMLVCLSGAAVPYTRQSGECLPPCNFYKKKLIWDECLLETEPQKQQLH